MTSQQPENSHSAEPEILDTEVIAVPAPAPVFVDSTGRRSKFLRRLAYAFGVLVMLYGGLISVSLAGGPVRSSAVLPLPGLETDVNDNRAPARPSPPPTPSASPSKAVFALPRRVVTRSSASRLEATKVAPKPTVKPTPSKTPTPKATTTHPVESTTTSAPTPTPSATTTTTAPVTKAPAPPSVAPVPPATGTGTGGQGGGEVVAGSDTQATTDSGSGSDTASGSDSDSGTASPSSSAEAAA